MMAGKIKILFLVLLGSYPPLFLYARNQGELSASSLIVPLILSIGIPVIVTIAWYPLLHNWLRASFIAAWFSISFWMAGYLGNYILFKDTINGIGEGVVTILLFGALYLVGRNWIALRPNINSQVISSVSILSAVLILYSCAVILPTEARRQIRHFSSESRSSVSDRYISRKIAGKNAPNVIDIVLDGYARGDVLESRYNQSNKKFLDGLRKRGFLILDESTTNYSTTALSITSMLNMNYVRKPRHYIGNGMDDVNYLAQHNAAGKFLRAHGYWYVTFQSGSTFTDGIISDEFRSYVESMDQYQVQLMQFTPLNLLLYTWLRDTNNDPYVLHRRRVSNALNGIATVNDKEKPLYIFAHVICPHPPFIFHADGMPTNPDRQFNMWDADEFMLQGGEKDEYIQGYKEQVTYLNRLVLKSIDRIQSMMNRPAIIILHSDHGPGSGFNFNNFEKSDLNERMSNLMAIHFPDSDYSSIYPTITGVNVYRAVFNKYFGAELKMLPDEHYFAHWNKPFEQIPVTLEQIKKDNNEHL